MRLRNKVLLGLILFIVLGSIVHPETSYAKDWKHYQSGVSLMNQGKYTQAIIEFEKAVAISPKASTFRQLAICFERTEQFQKAAETYYREAEIFRALGDLNTYQAVKNKGDALYTEIDIFTSQTLQLPKRQLGKYEPASGMYVGAYIEQHQINGHVNTFDQFNALTGKKHAVYFTYHHYGAPFPSKFAQQVKEAGGAIQLALEPSGGLNAVKDDQYLRQFARDAKAAGVPIFLRFASEMNGAWVAWHGNPAQYKQKFALVSKVMKEEAPNVAMAWVPNSVPVNNIDDYYPGDHAVDWVGLNLYSVPVFNGDPNKPAEHVNPLDLIDEFYHKYANKKPMMIGEYASSHFTSAGNKDVTKFGITKMKMFYHGLQMKYPRVKAVHWFNVDTINAVNIKEDRRLNNFNILANNSMLKAYSEVMKDPYFLSQVVNGPHVESIDSSTQVSVPLHNSTLFHSVTGIGFAKTYDPYISKIVYMLNGSKHAESNQYPYAFHLDHAKLKVGTNRLEAIVYDSKGRVAGRKAVSFKKGPNILKAKRNTLQLFIGENTVFNEHGPFQLLAPIYEKGGRSLVPIRFVSETLGASVSWNGATKQITIKSGSKYLVLTEGSRTVYVNNKKQTIDVAPEVRNGTTFVPLRFVTEVLGARVNYDQATKGIEINF